MAFGIKMDFFKSIIEMNVKTRFDVHEAVKSECNPAIKMDFCSPHIIQSVCEGFGCVCTIIHENAFSCKLLRIKPRCQKLIDPCV